MHRQAESETDTVQLHLVLPFRFEPRDDPRVKAYLDRGYRLSQYQRVTDREAILTLSR